MNEWMRGAQQFLSPWVYGILVCLIWFFVAFRIKHILIYRFSAFAKKTSFQVDDLLVASISTPLNLLILGAGILFLGQLIPLEAKIDRIITVVFQLSVVLAIVMFADRFLRKWFEIYQDALRMGISPKIMSVVLRTVLFGTAGLVFLDNMGISITPILASLGLGSLAVGLALQETLTNFFSGIHISFDQPIRVGDFIKLESGEEGYVTEIGWRSTRIRMLPNNMVIVPNQKITSSIITNYYLPEKELAVLVQVGVHYVSDLEKVERVSIEVGRDIMKRTQGGVPEFEPFIRYHTFDSSSINFTVVLRGKEFADQHLVKHEFVKALQARYRKEGIVIPFPMRTIDLPPETVDALKAVVSRK